MTAKSLDTLGQIGGPRCCKRNGYLAIQTAIDFAEEHLGVKMDRTTPVCTHKRWNNQCIKERCPFFGGESQ